jgi:hypothetical protein
LEKGRNPFERKIFIMLGQKSIETNIM